MKKILVGTILALMLGIVLLPSLAVAVDLSQPDECCEMRHTIEIGSDKVDKGDVVGPSSTAWCDLDNVGSGNEINTPLANWGLFCLLNSIMTITDWIFYILLLVSVIMIVIGGFMFIISAGSPEKATSAKNLIIFAIVGLIIAIIAKVIPSVVRYIVG